MLNKKPYNSKTKHTQNLESNSNSSTEIRLNIYLQEHGIASRRKADDLIKSGKVKVDGVAVTTLGTKISPASRVSVNGILIRKSIEKATYIFNKPDLTLTSRRAEQGMSTIYELRALKNLPPNVQAVGRLDFRSEGLLILTNDGDLAFALTHPKFSVEKTYACLVADSVTIEDIEKLRTGISLEDGMARAIAVRKGNKEELGNNVKGQWIEICVTEGRNRLIRRMLETIGLKVIKLVRIAIGELSLPESLTTGNCVKVNESQEKYLNKIKNDMLSYQKNDEKESTEVKHKPRKPFSIDPKPTLTPAEYAEEKGKRAFLSEKLRQDRKKNLLAAAAAAAAQEQTEVKEIVKKYPEKKLFDKTFTDKRFPEKKLYDQRYSDKRTEDRKFTGKKFGEKKHFEKKDGERTFSDRKFSDRKYPEKKDGERTFSDRKFSDRKYPEKKDGERTFSDRKFSDRKYPEKKDGERTFSDRKFSDRKYPEKKEGERTFSDRKFSDRKFSDRKYPEKKEGERTFSDRKFSDKKYDDKKVKDSKFSSDKKPASRSVKKPANTYSDVQYDKKKPAATKKPAAKKPADDK